jgi:hypothetical protein
VNLCPAYAQIETTENGYKYDEEGHDYKENRGHRLYGRILAHGNYSKLKLIVRSDKKEYDKGESVYIRFGVRNDSEDVVYLDTYTRSDRFLFLWSFFNSNNEKVLLTSWGKEQFEDWEKHNKYGAFRGVPNDYYRYHYYKLKPGEETETSLTKFRLSDYFHLIQPGEYRLTCFQIDFMHYQKYDPPLQSNTLTFRVLDTPLPKNQQNDPIKKEKAIELTEFVNPPRGEEVFEQKEEPKNIFYNPDTANEIIDISPHTYYRLRAEEEKEKQNKLEAIKEKE